MYTIRYMDKTKVKSQVVSIRLKNALFVELTKRARKARRTRSNYIVALLYAAMFDAKAPKEVFE